MSKLAPFVMVGRIVNPATYKLIFFIFKYRFLIEIRKERGEMGRKLLASCFFVFFVLFLVRITGLKQGKPEGVKMGEN